MPIRAFLSDQVFDPETIQKMTVALERVCNALGLKMVDDPATRLIAAKIIEQAQRGVRDVSKLTALTLKEFQQSKSQEGHGPATTQHTQ
jgi:hypothetical protein